MRLKAKLLSAHRLVDICKIIEKFGKNVDILISGAEDEKDVSFIVHGRAESSCQAWCLISRDSAFAELTCVSQNANKIGLSVEIKELVTCLRHCFNYDEVTLKLSKVSDKPVLAFEMQKQNRSILYVSNVAVTVLKASEVTDLVEPSLPHPVVCLFTPPAGVLSSVVSRMANVSTTCLLSASPTGTLALTSQAIDVSFESSWSQLVVYQVEGCESADAALSVPIQLLSKALSVHSMNPSNLMACFIIKPGTDVGGFLLFFNNPPYPHRRRYICLLRCRRLVAQDRLRFQHSDVLVSASRSSISFFSIPTSAHNMPE